MAKLITDFGAVGDGRTLNTEAFKKAMAAAKVNGEEVVVTPGVYLTGTIDLEASLYLEKGAVIKGSSNPEDYPEQNFVHNELGVLRALVVCLNRDNISISGEGTIDLSGTSFYDFSRPLIPASKIPYTEAQKKEATMHHDWRPSLSIFFHQCNNVTVKGVTLIDSPCWMLTLSECNDARVTGITIDTDLNVPNDDGIHLCSCNGVIISDCHISSGDDCIAISCITNWEKPCENVVVTNCVLRSCSKAIVMGYQYSHIRNILIDNVIIRESHRGLTFMAQKGIGLVENVRVKNMIIDTRVRAGNWWGNGEAIFMMAVDHDAKIPEEQKPDVRRDINMKNIYIDGVTCMSENALGFVGEDENIENVVLSDINYTRKESDNLALRGSVFDIQPAPELEIPVPENCAIYIDGAKSVELRDIKLNQFRGQDLIIMDTKLYTQNIV